MDDSTTYRSAGGRARAEKLSPEERSAIAKKAAAARWEEVTEAICGSRDNPLTIGEYEIECYVLEDGTRVITQGSFLRALGRHERVRRTGTEEGLPPIVQGKALKSFVSDELISRATPIPFRTPAGSKALGYNAELLPDICEVFLAARTAGSLPQNQHHIADRAELLVRGLARVGIIALVDEATGYQEMRQRDALAKILEEFVAKELQPWVKTFPPQYYEQMFRLRGLDYKKDTVRRPQYFGILTNDVVYERLAPGVLDELKRKVPKGSGGKAKARLHQQLTHETGHPKLREHLSSVVTIMKLSTNWEDFKMKIDTIHPKFGHTIPMNFDEDNGSL